MATDPERSRARRSHLIWMAISGALCGLAALAALSQPRGVSFIDGRGILAGGLVVWWGASAVLSTALVWAFARGRTAVVAFNLLGVVLIPPAAFLAFRLDDALWLRQQDSEQQRLSELGRITLWSRTDTGRDTTIEGEFNSGFNGKVRFELLDGQSTPELPARRGETVHFSIGPFVLSEGSSAADGIRIFCDGKQTALASTGEDYTFLGGDGILRQALPQREPTQRELDEARPD